MRIWSLHPQYLDRQGLTACWREALLAQSVLAGRTRGYRHHSQLDRFRDLPGPLATIGAYLSGVAEEATRRDYRFDVSRILEPAAIAPKPPLTATVPADTPLVVARLPVTDGQIAHEWDHLMTKLASRSPAQHSAQAHIRAPAAHPLFVAVPGPVEAWERT